MIQKIIVSKKWYCYQYFFTDLIIMFNIWSYSSGFILFFAWNYEWFLYNLIPLILKWIFSILAEAFDHAIEVHRIKFGLSLSYNWAFEMKINGMLTRALSHWIIYFLPLLLPLLSNVLLYNISSMCIIKFELFTLFVLF